MFFVEYTDNDVDADTDVDADYFPLFTALPPLSTLVFSALIEIIPLVHDVIKACKVIVMTDATQVCKKIL